MRVGWAGLIVGLMAVGALTPEIAAQKGKPTPPASGGPSDAVFADLAGVDRIRSDGFQTIECGSGVAGEESRYCGGSFTDPETGLTYDGVGPECSRILHGSGGEYTFRTISSKCGSYPPVATHEAGHRQLVLDFSQDLSGVCRNGDTGDNLISRTVGNVTRTLNACGVNRISDVRILASNVFSGTSSSTVIYISLHEPPLANTTQFLLEFALPLEVSGQGDTRTLTATPAHTAVLWEVTLTRSGKLQKVGAPIGEYVMPFQLTARKAPMPVFAQ